MINLSKNNLVDVKTANSMQANLKVQEAEEPAIPANDSVRTEVEDITDPTQLSDDFKFSLKKFWKGFVKVLKALVEGPYYIRYDDGSYETNLW